MKHSRLNKVGNSATRQTFFGMYVERGKGILSAETSSSSSSSPRGEKEGLAKKRKEIEEDIIAATKLGPQLPGVAQKIGIETNHRRFPLKSGLHMISPLPKEAHYYYYFVFSRKALRGNKSWATDSEISSFSPFPFPEDLET